ncbi:hypothetical protein ANCCAN_23997 [Ancylostoma caninum]|uniref:Galactokinase N-terminal domain-containing protein n=1 Tax=Ancylostoma caninum TaxID=29170 RepID=A0A368FDH0_ANCCA|nr:hypothetical protein ANCCAN_23997 [Ancylostoma caninum]
MFQATVPYTFRSILLLPIFENLFGHPPAVRTYCPGRIILMGDHLDYHDYGVITMTTHEGTQILAARNGRNEIRIVSKDPDEQ